MGLEQEMRIGKRRDRWDPKTMKRLAMARMHTHKNKLSAAYIVHMGQREGRQWRRVVGHVGGVLGGSSRVRVAWMMSVLDTEAFRCLSRRAGMCLEDLVRQELSSQIPPLLDGRESKW